MTKYGKAVIYIINSYIKNYMHFYSSKVDYTNHIRRIISRTHVKYQLLYHVIYCCCCCDYYTADLLVWDFYYYSRYVYVNDSSYIRKPHLAAGYPVILAL